jgi:hypothetical protein
MEKRPRVDRGLFQVSLQVMPGLAAFAKASAAE